MPHPAQANISLRATELRLHHDISDLHKTLYPSAGPWKGNKARKPHQIELSDAEYETENSEIHKEIENLKYIKECFKNQEVVMRKEEEQREAERARARARARARERERERERERKMVRARARASERELEREREKEMEWNIKRVTSEEEASTIEVSGHHDTAIVENSSTIIRYGPYLQVVAMESVRYIRVTVVETIKYLGNGVYSVGQYVYENTVGYAVLSARTRMF